jgi:transposase
MNRAVPPITERADELNVLLKAEHDAKCAQRLQMLYLFASGQANTRKAAAALLGVHRETVGDWLARYVAGGRDALCERRTPPGKAPSVTPEVEQALRTALATPTGFPSYGAIGDWLWQHYGIRLSYSAVHALVHDKLQARPKVVRRSSAKKNLTP